MGAEVPRLSPRFVAALEFAIAVHSGDVRKGDPPLPYVSHLIGVAGLVLEDGGSEDEAIAGLLHDTAEDHGGEDMLKQVEERFGSDVELIVRGCSDSLLPEGQTKLEWRERKETYLAHLHAEKSASTLRVSNADKLHNARAIVADYRTMRNKLWEKFTTRNGSDQYWYYDELATIFCDRRSDSALARELRATVDELRELMLANDEDPAASGKAAD